MKLCLSTALFLIFFLFSFSCHNKHSRRSVILSPPPAAASLVQISIQPEHPSIPVGKTQPFAATGTYDDQSQKDLTGSVTWSSSDPQVATIGDASPSKGVASALQAGAVTITATLEGLSGSTTLTVTPPALVSIAVTPTNPSLALGSEQDFEATGTYDNETTQDLTQLVTWTSSDHQVATIGNDPGSKGHVQTLTPGTTVIAAALDGVSGSTTLTVTPATLRMIGVTPQDPSIAVGTTLQFTATGTYTDQTTQDLTSQVTWSSSDEQVASISNEGGTKGLATGRASGSSTITASLENVEGSTTLTVTGAALVSIAVTPSQPTIVAGTERQFSATGTYSDNATQDLTAQATWESSDTRVATVSDAGGSKGLAIGLEAGTTTITASLGAVKGSTTLTVVRAALLSIGVTPANPSIALGTSQAFQATGSYDNQMKQDLTAQVTWSSSEAAVAAISNASASKGVATSVSTGSTIITVTLGGVSGSTTLTVTAAALVSIAVTPARPSIALGTDQAFTATGSYSDGSSQNLTVPATWASSETRVATISNAAGTNGLAKSGSIGSTTITATFGGVSGSTALTVTAAALLSLTVSPQSPSITVGAEQIFVASGDYTDGSSQDLTSRATWSSSDAQVATISNSSSTKGLAVGISPGATTITATLDEAKGSTFLRVTTAGVLYSRCDANQDEQNDIADAVWILMRIVQLGSEPPCWKAADCNDDGGVDVRDAIYCLDYQLRGGPRPPDPFPSCGIDLSEDGLSCDAYDRCR